ncbi:MAG: lipopolysaccharide biosynthesis protein, partial [Actinomycetota bacterium]
MSDAEPTRDIRSRALRSLAWAYGALLSHRVLLLVSTLVLARLLDPSEFGIVAFALAVIAYLSYLTDLGMTAALVQRQDARDPAVASTVFWLSVSGAAVLTAIAWFAAPAIARVGPDPLVEDVVRALSVSFFIGAFGGAQAALYEHSLEFRPLAVRQIGAGLAKGTTSIALAAAGAGVWSLVAGQLVGATVGVLLLWWGSSWRPSAVVSRAQVPSLLRFGGAITALGFLSEVGRSADYIIVGARAGAEALGLYYLAFRLPDVVIAAASQVAWRVLFPAYARLKDAASGDGSGLEALGRGYLRTVRLVSLVVFPAAFGLAALATPIVVTLFGRRWENAADAMALLAIWAAVEGVE